MKIAAIQGYPGDRPVQHCPTVADADAAAARLPGRGLTPVRETFIGRVEQGEHARRPALDNVPRSADRAVRA